MRKVLVVDDEEPILELLKYNLEKEGYSVKTATDWLQALEIAKKFQHHDAAHGWCGNVSPHPSDAGNPEDVRYLSHSAVGGVFRGGCL